MSVNHERQPKWKYRSIADEEGYMSRMTRIIDESDQIDQKSLGDCMRTILDYDVKEVSEYEDTICEEVFEEVDHNQGEAEQRKTMERRKQVTCLDGNQKQTLEDAENGHQCCENLQNSQATYIDQDNEGISETRRHRPMDAEDEYAPFRRRQLGKPSEVACEEKPLVLRYAFWYHKFPVYLEKVALGEKIETMRAQDIDSETDDENLEYGVTKNWKALCQGILGQRLEQINR